MEVLPIPIVHLGLSYRCNMRCDHCYVNKKKDLLSKEKYFKLIDELYELGLFVLYYTYGEPLLADNFFEIAAYAKQKKIVQVLMSNGYLIDESMAGRIKDVGISQVYISIDHIDAVKHDKNRHVKGAYNNALMAIKYLQHVGVYCGISCTVTEQNAQVLPDIYRLAIERNVDSISFLRERSNGGLGYLSQKGFDVYKKFFVETVCDENKHVLFHDYQLLPILQELYTNDTISAEIYEKYVIMNQCHLKQTVCIEPSGRITRCNICPVEIGDYHTDTIKEAVARTFTGRNCFEK